MALEILASLIPTTVGGVVALLIQIAIMWIVIILADEFIAHQVEAKRSLVLAALAYFISPLVLAFAAINIPFAGIIVPLIVWVVLGEVLLRAWGATNRLKVALVAFAIYFVLNYFGIPGMIAAAVAF